MTTSTCLFIVPILFGTFNRPTASAAEAKLSQSIQTAFANFAKNPVNASLAPSWPPYERDFLGIAPVPALARIAYQGNVGFDDFVQPVQPISTVSMINVTAKLDSSLSAAFTNRMGRALYGTLFWISALRKSPISSGKYFCKEAWWMLKLVHNRLSL